jgi:GrpB-like predicted nucleotidyltransferase (UPF0157 family)
VSWPKIGVVRRFAEHGVLSPVPVPVYFRLAGGPPRRTVWAVPPQYPPSSALASLPPALATRLAAAGVDDITDPLAAWLRLRAAEGRRVTLIDLFDLVAAPRGLTAWELPAAERRSLAASAMSVVMPGFSVAPGSERAGDPLQIVPYDPDWPIQYAGWRELFVRVLGPVALRVEHVGSTSIPGLAAKPVIDVQISVADVTDEPSYLPPLGAAGMQLRSTDDVHRFLRPHPGQPRNVHVHVCSAGSAWERDHLLFRDYVRAHPAARDDYARAKQAAIRTWADDRWAYTEAKTGIILDILAAAGQWATATSWALPPTRTAD